MRNVTREQVEAMSNRELVSLYNELCPEKPVKRFSRQSTGVRRVLEALEAARAAEQAAAPAGPEQPAQAGPEGATTAEQPPTGDAGAGTAPTRAKRRRGVQRFEPEGEVKPPRPNSKRGKLLDWLLEPEGMPEEAIAEMFEWKQRDVMDALRLLAKANGYVVYQGDEGVWRAAEPEAT